MSSLELLIKQCICGRFQMNGSVVTQREMSFCRCPPHVENSHAVLTNCLPNKDKRFTQFEYNGIGDTG